MTTLVRRSTVTVPPDTNEGQAFDVTETEPTDEHPFLPTHYDK
jgi:hypothetical protein